MGAVLERLYPVLEVDFPQRMSEIGVPGAAVALIESGEVKFMRCYGFANVVTRRPVASETLFSLQSISKSVAAWAIMRLVQEGRIDLDRPISFYLKSWAFPPGQKFDTEQVTARRLLSHHAGISTSGFRGVEIHHQSYGLLEAMRAQLPPLTEEQSRYFALWNLPEDQPVHLAYPPGNAWHYSNPGFAILELAIEDITGISFADYVTSNVLSPLRMQKATYLPDLDADVATPYTAGNSQTKSYRNISRAAAGLFASIEDLAVFTQSAINDAHTASGRNPVLSRAAFAEMYQGYGAADQSSGVPFEAGLGHLVLNDGRYRNVHHSGGTLGWRSVFSAYPDIGSGVCILMNSDLGNELWIPFVKLWRDATMDLHH